MSDMFKDLGFESEEEFHRMVAAVDISDTSVFPRFKQWQEHDGTKAGLLELLPKKEPTFFDFTTQKTEEGSVEIVGDPVMETVPIPAPGGMFIVVDLETTGLNNKTDSILEVGAILFDPAKREIVDKASWLVRPVREFKADDFVLDMHTKNGLWAALGHPQRYIRLKEWTAPDGLISYKEIQTVLINFLQAHGVKKRGAHICGNSIASFDIPFLRRYAPLFVQFCHHRAVDVSGIWLALNKLRPDLCPEKVGEMPHRALDDARASLMFLLEIMDGLPK